MASQSEQTTESWPPVKGLNFKKGNRSSSERLLRSNSFQRNPLVALFCVAAVFTFRQRKCPVLFEISAVNVFCHFLLMRRISAASLFTFISTRPIRGRPGLSIVMPRLLFLFRLKNQPATRESRDFSVSMRLLQKKAPVYDLNHFISLVHYLIIFLIINRKKEKENKIVENMSTNVVAEIRSRPGHVTFLGGRRRDAAPPSGRSSLCTTSGCLLFSHLRSRERFLLQIRHL